MHNDNSISSPQKKMILISVANIYSGMTEAVEARREGEARSSKSRTTMTMTTFRARPLVPKNRLSWETHSGQISATVTVSIGASIQASRITAKQLILHRLICFQSGCVETWSILEVVTIPQSHMGFPSACYPLLGLFNVSLTRDDVRILEWFPNSLFQENASRNPDSVCRDWNSRETRGGHTIKFCPR